MLSYLFNLNSGNIECILNYLKYTTKMTFVFYHFRMQLYISCNPQYFVQAKRNIRSDFEKRQKTIKWR